MVGLPCGQFHGDSSWDRCTRIVCIWTRFSALPIMIDDRQARIANMSRTLRAAASMKQLPKREDRHLHCVDAERRLSLVQHSKTEM